MLENLKIVQKPLQKAEILLKLKRLTANKLIIVSN